MPKEPRPTRTSINKRSSPSAAEIARPKKRSRKQNGQQAGINNTADGLDVVEDDSPAISQFNQKNSSNAIKRRKFNHVSSPASHPIDEEVEAEEEFTMASTPNKFAASMTKYTTGKIVLPF